MHGIDGANLFEQQAKLVDFTFHDLFANLYGPWLLIKTCLLATPERRNHMDRELGQVREERKRHNKEMMIEIVTYKWMLITNISIFF